ncbi:hypothetical protein AAFC00_000324 [Neodothiora populina]|uniref:Ankyrin n=1 Tax=Neodothiora populina TaxID=2781224 RepID=A0ABR3PCK3_9PEZI
MIDASARLRRAILLNDVLIVKRIVQSHPKLLQNPDYQDKSNTSLHIAAQAGFEEIVQFLFDAGHDAEEISLNVDWDTPLMVACRHGQVEIGRMLIKRFPRCIPWTNKKGLDAISMSCLHPSSTELIPLLLSHPTYPASVQSRDNKGDTPLHHASAAGSLKALRVLLSAGADPLAKNSYDWTPLAYSQTVAAEVYFKNLVMELERRKIDGVRGERERREEQQRRKGAGVRLVTGDDDGIAVRPSAEYEWSPTTVRGSYTPNLGGSSAWSELAGITRARALSGD